MSEDVHNSDDVLDRAVTTLRDASIPLGPLPLTAQRAVSALWAAEARAQLSRSRWMMGAAAAVVLGCTTIVTVILSHPAAHQIAGSATPRITVPAPAPSTFRENREPANSLPEEQHPIAPVAPGLAVPPHRQPTTAFASAISVTGHVFFDGVPPPRRLIDLSAYPQCAHVLRGPVVDDSLVVSEDGALQNVVVSVSAGLPPGERFPTPPGPVVLDQKYCAFEPHVIAAMIGQDVQVRNSDPLLHSVHALDSDEAPAFNFAQPTVGVRQIDPFQAVKTFKVRCDLHPWMTAWVRVFNHPYFDVTHADGTFAIKDLPPGTYHMKAWHELLGVQEKEVSVHGGEPVVLDFTFQAR